MASRAWRLNRHHWNIAPPVAAAAELARRMGTDPLVAQILCNRGVTSVEEGEAFLNPKLSDLLDPRLLPGAEAAAERIIAAIRDKKRIVIYGDYDVDGITAVAILHGCLKLLGGEVDYYVPHRLDEGYGINAAALEKIIAEGAKLLITVDCGISDSESLGRACAAGLEVIVTDHHSLPDRLPEVSAIVHPLLESYPNPHLSGAGVAFKLAWQIARGICGNERVDEPLREFLLNATCMAALGTIADVVPLLGENRSLATHGLKALPQCRHPGLKALLESANLGEEKKIDAFHVGFVLAPRINACGRMGHAHLAVELLTEAPPDRCKEIADYLDKQNAERQKTEQGIVAEAVEMAQTKGLDRPENRAIVLWSDQWHGGVIGIVASRLVERFSRPVILIAINEDRLGQGSGRSIAGFHMRDALAACEEYLVSFGGHAMAGGLRIKPERIEAFSDAFTQYANRHVSEEQLTTPLAIDVETSLGSLNYHVAAHIEKLAPFGQGNPSPLVAIRGCEIISPPRRMGRNGSTVGMILRQGNYRMRAVGFSMGDLADALVGTHTVDIVALPVLNRFNGQTSVELQLKDIRWD